MKLRVSGSVRARGGRRLLFDIARAAGVASLGIVAVALGLGREPAATGAVQHPAPQVISPRLAATAPQGYWLVASDGGIFNYGAAGFHNSAGNIPLAKPIVGMAATPSGRGYWLVASDGGIFTFGDATFHGSTGAIHLNQPIVGMAATPDGGGYWLVASDGGIFSFGTATFHGSTGAIHLNQPIVGMAATPDGGGYWLVASDGGIFSFGTATFHGSTGAIHLNKPIVGMTSAPDGAGYWMVASDGGIFNFGSAGFFGSAGNIALNQPIIGMGAAPDGAGYWLGAADGGIFRYGSANFLGSAGGVHLNKPIVGMAAFPRLVATGISVSPGSATNIDADQGSVGAPITATVTDAFGNPVPGEVVDFGVDPLANGGLSTLVATTDANGNATTNLVDTHAGDQATVVASIEGGLFSATTGTLTIVPGHATAMAFTTQPNNSSGGIAFPTQPVVTLQDAFGNLASNDGSAVTLAVTSGTGTSGASLACTTNPQNVSGGTASFSGCNVDKVGTGYTLTATDGSIPSVASSSFDITAGPAAKLGFTQQPSASSVSQTAFTTQPKVAIEDAGGNVITGNTSSVTLAITTGTGTSGAILACTNNTVAASAGVATFAGCKVDKAGTGYTLTATDGGLTAGTSSAFAITPGPASKLGFTQQPGGASGGSAFTTQPTVAVEDAQGNTVTTDTSSVALAITSGTGTTGAALHCTGGTTLAATAGMAGFTGCKIDRVGTAYTLTATDGSLTSAASNAFNVTVGPASQLAFTQQPGGASGGTAFTTQPTVTVEDAGGNTVTTDTSSVTLAITSGTGASGAVLSCIGSDTLAATAGVASFAGCKIDKAGSGYTLTATDGSLPATMSNAFTVAVGPGAQLAFTQQPSGSTGGVAFPTQPKVTVFDAGGNLASTDTSTVTLAIKSGTGTAGAALNCTGGDSVAAVAGVATFSGCNVNKAGSSYQLTATDSSMTPANSTAFTITVGPATHLGYTQQPGGATGGTPFTTQPVVAVQDAGGNTVTTDTSSVTLAITSGTGASGAHLQCTGGDTLAASAGLASFSGCKIDTAHTGYTLTATDSALTSAVSASFDVTVGPAAQTAFTQQPSSSTTAGTPFSTQPKVSVEDAGGNVVTTDSSTVTLGITSGTGNSQGTLTCTGSDSATAVQGVATFAGCSVDKSGAGYTLTASDAALTAGTSSAFSITPGSASMLAFTRQPAGATGGSAFTTQPTVSVEDLHGNVVTGDSSSITLAISTGTGTTGAVLACTGGNTMAASAGGAAFAGCNIDKVGTGYTLRATDSALTPATSTAFNVTTGTASKLVFSAQPSNSTGGTAFGTQPQVTIEDAGGNTVSGNTSSVTLAITSGTGTAGAALSCTGGDTLAATAGVASFTGCRVDKSGTGYTLTATDGALPSAASNSFNVTVGTAAQLAFAAQPASSTGGVAFPTQPAVTIEDAGGNTVTGNTSTVALAITSGTGANGANLTCTGGQSMSATAGVASFAGCKIDKAATGYTLTATDGALTAAISTAFNVSVGPAVQLHISTQPSGGTGGTAWATQPVVTIVDNGGNVVTTDTSTVMLAITSGTGTSGAVLGCTGGYSLAATAGVASFTGCKIDKVGTGYTLTATDGTLGSTTTNAFNITAGPAATMAFTQSPNSTTGGTVFTTQPQVTLLDAGGNTATGDTSAVALAVTSGTGTAGATLTCTGGDSLAATAGVATFSGCKVDKAGSNYTLTATDGALPSVASSQFTITVGAPSQLGFSVEPADTTSGVTMSAVSVQVQDAGRNLVSTATNGVSLSLNPTAALSGTTTRLSSGGVATFTGLSIVTSGTYTMTAKSTGLTDGTSTSFIVSPGPASQLAFSVQPAGATGGTAFTTQPVVDVEDAGGNVVTTDTSNVTLALTAGTGTSGATFGCTANTVAASSGVATFAGCKIDKTGTGYTLTATDGSLTSVASSTFNVTVGPAKALAFKTQPAGATGGTAFTTQPQVQVNDAGGNLVSTDTSNVTLALNSGTGTSGATFGCTTNPVAASSGVATFAGCKIDKTGTGYKLTATDGSLTATMSAAFDVTTGSASQLAFSQQPSASTASQTPFATQPSVSVEDPGGNVVTAATNSVTLAITSGTGTLGAALNCTGGDALAASSGVAAFSGCNVDKVGSGYTLTATASGLTSTISTAFAITPGTASKLVVTTSPAGASGGSAFGTQPVVAVEDAAGNTVTSDASQVSLAITSGTGTSGATLTCAPVTASSGVATFSGCSIDKSGTGYTLTATDGSLTPGVSGTFTVTEGTAFQVGFVQEPSSSVSQVAFTTQPKVAVQDRGGNTVTTDSSTSVTLAITSGTGTAGATLACSTNPVTVSSGVATFAGCKVNKAGTGYTLTATDGSLQSGTSTAFAITPAPASQLVVTQQPSGASGGTAFTTQPTISVEDPSGNVVTTDTSTVTLAINSGTGTSGATLTCAGGVDTLTATAGVAAFSGCTIDKSGTGYTLHATDGALTAADTNPFNVSVGTAAQVAFTQQASGGTGGTAWTTQPKVSIEDAGGNVVTTDTSSVHLAIKTGTGTTGAGLSCTANPQAASAGVASFGGCTINLAGNNYKLTATDGSLASADSTAFNVTVGAATHLVFTQQPASATGGSAFGTQPQVSVEDAGGNVVTTDTSLVTMTISSGTGTTGAILTCTSTTAIHAVAGVAAFTGCAIDKSGTGYTLHVTDGTLQPATSNAFDVTVGPASQLMFTQQPTDANTGATITPAVTVTIEDAGGNTVTTATSSVTMAIANNAGPGTLSGTLTKAAVSGVATFSDLSINNEGHAYTLSATATSLASATSSAFNIIGQATQMVFSTQPVNSTADALSTVAVTIEDASGDVVTGATNGIQLSLATNPGTASLDGTTLKTPTNGVASFTDLQVTKVGTGYQLGATSTGLTAPNSNTFNITPGVATQVAVACTCFSSGTTYHPTAATMQTFTLHVQDQFGNTVTTSSASITVTLTPGATSDRGILTGSNSIPSAPDLTAAVSVTVTASSGAGTFTYTPPASLPSGGTGTITFASTGLTAANSVSVVD
jgi:hypothetical protein